MPPAPLAASPPRASRRHANNCCAAGACGLPMCSSCVSTVCHILPSR
jgi:hypothetical protein